MVSWRLSVGVEISVELDECVGHRRDRKLDDLELASAEPHKVSKELGGRSGRGRDAGGLDWASATR